MFIKLEPGFYYDQYADDELFIQSLRNWEITLRSNDKLLAELREKGIDYRTKRGCACTGGHLNVIFKGIEVVE